jgi:amidase
MQWPFTESATFGVTRNPWDLERAPGGSSGGSAAAVAAGLAGAALGTDGAGSIRIPAACCGLFGLKPQRGRVSYAPKVDGWGGMSVIGGLTRSVIDSARYLDAIAEHTHAGAGSGHDSGSATPFADAARREPGRLRIGYSAKTPLPNPISSEQRGAFEATIELLRSLGHTVEPVDVPYGDTILQVIARYLRGIHDDAAELAHPERLERRTRGMARLGGLVTPALFARARAAEGAAAIRLGAVLAGHDVLLTPALAQLPLPIGRYEGRGALWTFNGVGRFTPYTATWNVTGQPAAAVPAGFTPAGVPLAVQLVGRPHDEATLLSLSAQLEAVRPWADRRPPVAA